MNDVASSSGFSFRRLEFIECVGIKITDKNQIFPVLRRFERRNSGTLRAMDVSLLEGAARNVLARNGRCQ